MTAATVAQSSPLVGSFKTRQAKRARRANERRKAGVRAPRPRRARALLSPQIRALGA